MNVGLFLFFVMWNMVFKKKKGEKEYAQVLLENECDRGGDDGVDRFAFGGGTYEGGG